jgi:hypothetical protein
LISSARIFRRIGRRDLVFAVPIAMCSALSPDNVERLALACDALADAAYGGIPTFDIQISHQLR